MSDVRATLIDVFAKHSCAEVESTPKILVDAFLERNYDAVKALAGFDQEYSYASTAKQRIEIIAERFKDDAGQALQCLNWLKSLRAKTIFKNDEYEVARQLMLKTLYLQWKKQADRVLFDARARRLSTIGRIFSSHTRRATPWRQTITTNN